MTDTAPLPRPTLTGRVRPRGAAVPAEVEVDLGDGQTIWMATADWRISQRAIRDFDNHARRRWRSKEK